MKIRKRFTLRKMISRVIMWVILLVCAYWVEATQGRQTGQTVSTPTQEAKLSKPREIKLAGVRAGDIEVATITQLTTEGEYYSMFQWSPDGKKLFVHKYKRKEAPKRYEDMQVVIIDVETGSETVSNLKSLGEWSPDGTKILYEERVKEEDGKITYWISVIDIDGTNNRRLYKGGSYPKWSPDGKKIVFTEIGERCKSTGRIISYNIKTMNIDGTDVRTIVSGDINEPDVVWLPSGRIAYTKENPKDPIRETIYTINPDGTNEKVLVENITGFLRWWLADEGKSKAYFSKNYTDWVIDEDGGNLIEVKSDVFVTSWSPDGTKFVGMIMEIPDYGPYEGQLISSDIYIMNLDGSELKQLTNTHDLLEVGADWSPDGDKIAYKEDKSRNIYVIKLVKK